MGAKRSAAKPHGIPAKQLDLFFFWRSARRGSPGGSGTLSHLPPQAEPAPVASPPPAARPGALTPSSRRSHPALAPATPPLPPLHERWTALRAAYFPNQPELDAYRIVWSTRKHKRTLASCNVYRRRVSVAMAMTLPEAEPHLDALLYHEMCHAALGVPKRAGGRRILHGREFRELERRHPGIVLLDRWIIDRGWSAAVRKFNRAAARSNGFKSTPTPRKR